MKQFISQLLFIGICLFSITLTHAGFEINTKFLPPGKICFPQTSLHAQFNEFESVMFEHYLIVSKEHHFKTGNIFVGFRLKSQPGALWLYDGFRWIKYDNTNNLPAYAFMTNPHIQHGQLQPVTPTFISNYPIDVSAYVGDGELWVGYGLRSATGIAQESFDEMISSNRFNLIWEIGEPLQAPGNLVNVSLICLVITEMDELVPITQ